MIDKADIEMPSPTKNDGTPYRISDVMSKKNSEQRKIIFMVLSKIKEWITFPRRKEKSPNLTFKPLLLTVMGEGGTGKSFLIHLLKTIVNTLFPSSKTSVSGAPTGAAAFNILSTTIHALFGIKPNRVEFNLNGHSRNNIIDKFKRAIMLILDERSMISQELLGQLDYNLCEALTPDQKNAKFGGIPIIIIFGDDHQLPPVCIKGRGKAAFHHFDNKDNTKGTELERIENRGMTRFLELSNKVVKLTVNHRSNGCSKLRNILQNLRQDELTSEQVTMLQRLHVTRLNPKHREKVIKDAIYIYANKEPTRNHNYAEVYKLNDVDNPIAMVKSYVRNTKKSDGRKHFKDSKIPNVSILCKGAKVAITGKNFQANWGLFNGSVGTVVHISYGIGENPNSGDLPSYVIVDFPNYRNGPVWNTKHPTVSCHNHTCTYDMNIY